MIQRPAGTLAKQLKMHFGDSMRAGAKQRRPLSFPVVVTRDRRWDRRPERPLLQLRRVASNCPAGVGVSRVVVTLLVAVQALLPPGMCVCQFVPVTTAARPVHGTALAIPTATDESCCDCPACRNAAHAVTPPTHAPAVTDTDARPERPPLPASPCTGCPVVTACPAARLAILPAPAPAPLDIAVAIFLWHVDPAPRRIDRPHPAFTHATSPRFARCCALLI